MKLSLKWAQQYSNVDLFKDGEDKLLEKIGSQLGAIDEVTHWGELYDGIVVVKIVKCEPHPDADNLKLCWVDDNGVVKEVQRTNEGLVQIVCGGSNARADMFGVWIPPGATVPSSVKIEPLILEVREIRGQKSIGMLASPSELVISDVHAGILEVKADDIGFEPKAGQAIKELYSLDDIIVDIENKMFTHRPDLFGILGIARELAGISHQKFKSPEWYLNLAPDAFKQTAFEELDFSAQNNVPDLVPRFLAIAMSDIKVAPSPYWVQAALTRVGIKPINNVVDITNFVMHLTGQPLHAFDYDKVAAKKSAGIEARLAKEGESLTLLGNKKIQLNSENIVIASLGGPAIALGGVMGGVDTEVDDNTQNIVIECANFDMYLVRKTSMQHGVFTDAVTRYTKGQSPLQNDVVLAYAVKLMSEITNAKTASQLTDIGHDLSGSQSIKVNTKFINERLGLNLTTENCSTHLNNVELITTNEGDSINIKVPFWRTDLEIKEDIVEEVGRLNGFDNLPRVLPKRHIKPTAQNPGLELKSKIRQILSRAGANETLNYSFVNNKLLDCAGQDENLAFQIRNALSPDLQYYRLSLAPSLLEKIHSNVKIGYDEFAIFELGKTHLNTDLDDHKIPLEHNRLAVAINKPSVSASYYQAKQYIEYLFSSLHIDGITYEPLLNCQRALSQDWVETANSYEAKHSAGVLIGSSIIGIIGEPNSKINRALKLGNSVSCFELDTDQILKFTQTEAYKELNKYPSTQQDITLKMSVDITYSNAQEKLVEFFEEQKQKSGYEYRLQALSIYEKQSDGTHKNISWRIELWHNQKTLTTEEVNNLLDELANWVKTELSANRV